MSKLKLEQTIKILEANDELIKSAYKNLKSQLESFKNMINDPKKKDYHGYSSNESGMQEEQQPINQESIFQQESKTFIDNLIKIKTESSKIILKLPQSDMSLKSNKGFDQFVNESIQLCIDEEMDIILQQNAEDVNAN